MIPMEYIFGAGALVGVALYIVFGGDLIPSFSINTSPGWSHFNYWLDMTYSLTMMNKTLILHVKYYILAIF